MKSRLFNRQSEDHVFIGEKRVAIPKLTIAKWKALFEVIEGLPQVIVSVLSTRQSDDFVTTAVVGASLAIDEAVRVVGVLTDLEPAYIEENADLNELIGFIVATAKKNDLANAAKNFQAVLDLVAAPAKAADGSGN
ncbi:hypothetical protein [Paenibacillus xanthanilyticus]|uniref:Tail assembly chaperone n=1 Tax=Paenibacillus xanthanilyticus TaxID=1783531 RepID=A0ABV8KC44_9BACL